MPLFGGTGPRRTPRPAPLARSTDPESSRLAADAVTASGARASQKRAILAALSTQTEPLTSLELAHAMGMDRYIVARRLPDLARDGRVERAPMRECREGHRPAITWRARG